MNQAIQEALNWRYAVKRYDPSRKISPADWQTLEQSLQLAPSSYGLQPWKFLIVKNPQLRTQLKAVSWNQSQVEEASHLVVFTALKKMDEAYVDKYLQSIVKTRGVPAESLQGYRDMMINNVVKGGQKQDFPAWAQRQAYIAMGFLMQTAALLKIDSTPMEGLDPAKYDELLKLQSTPYATVAAVALGYRHAEDGYQHGKKVRFDKEEIIQVVG